MQKTIGGELFGQELQDYLHSNSDAVENMRYFQAHEADEGTQLRAELATESIALNDIEMDKKDSDETFKYLMKPLKTKISALLSEIRENGKFVEENLFKMVDLVGGEVGYYNKHGHLVHSRPIRPDEKQGNIFKTDKYIVREAI